MHAPLLHLSAFISLKLCNLKPQSTLLLRIQGLSYFAFNCISKTWLRQAFQSTQPLHKPFGWIENQIFCFCFLNFILLCKDSQGGLEFQRSKDSKDKIVAIHNTTSNGSMRLLSPIWRKKLSWRLIGIGYEIINVTGFNLEECVQTEISLENMKFIYFFFHYQ